MQVWSELAETNILQKIFRCGTVFAVTYHQQSKIGKMIAATFFVYIFTTFT